MIESLESRSLFASPYGYIHTSIHLNTHTEFVATGKLDNDNTPDIVTSSYADSSLTFLYAQPDYQFGKQSLLLTFRPDFVAVKDINNDGLDDIIYAGYEENKVGVLKKRPDIGYDGEMYDVQGVRAVEITDINKDGLKDIVAAKSYRKELSVLFNNGGGFSVQTTPLQYTPNDVTSCDYDNDGDSDIVAVDFFKDKAFVLSNNNGSLQQSSVFSTGEGPSHVVATDLNNDGSVEIITANFLSDTISIVSPLVDKRIQVGRNPTWISLININGDQYKDIVVAAYGSDATYTTNANLELTRFKRVTYVYHPSRYSSEFLQTRSIAVADFNSDGNADIVMTAENASQMSVFWGFGKSAFWDFTHQNPQDQIELIVTNI